MSKAMDAQMSGEFEEMSDRDKEIQASIWALIFLVSELSLAFRTLRDKLHERGALQPEDEAEINRLASAEERMRVAYAHIENAFQEKYHRVMEAMLHPEEVEQAVARSEFVDLNRQDDLPTVSG